MSSPRTPLEVDAIAMRILEVLRSCARPMTATELHDLIVRQWPEITIARGEPQVRDYLTILFLADHVRRQSPGGVHVYSPVVR